MQLFLHPYFFFLIAFSLLIYWRCPRNSLLRDWVLLVASLVFLASLHPLFAALAVLGATVAHRVAGPGRGRAFLFLTASGLVVFFLGKMGPSLAQRFAQGTWVEKHALVPLGLSFFLFRLFQYGADRYRGTLRSTSWLSLMLFLFFFPTLPAGPLDTYQGFQGRKNGPWDSRQFAEGLRRILTGYFKKLFLVGWLFDYFLKDFTTGFFTLTSLEIARSYPAAPLVYVTVMFVYAYLDLSSYTDIAVGLGALYGIRVPENFDRPFLRSNLADFWRSWHMSVSQWCRNQVYFPVFGLSRKPWLATYASMATLGLWHQLSWNWLAWAGYHASGLVAYSHWKRRYPASVPTWRGKIFGGAATLLFVALGYAFVSTPNLASAWRLVTACLTPWEGNHAG